MTERHWCTEPSSLALKTLKERHWEKHSAIPLTNDIKLFHSFTSNLADTAYAKLQQSFDVENSYKTLTECVLAETVMFNRKRIGDGQYLTIAAYSHDNRSISQEEYIQLLTDAEKLLARNLKELLVAGGKGSKPVAILFSKMLQKLISCLFKVRTDFKLVSDSNPYLFVNVGSEYRWISGVNVIRK